MKRLRKVTKFTPSLLPELNDVLSVSFLKPAHEKMGVVDSQWIVHQTVPSLAKQVCYT